MNTGISAVGVSIARGQRRGALERAKLAVRDAVARAGVCLETVDALLYCGVHRDDAVCEPALAALLWTSLLDGVPARQPLCFDVTAGATGVLHASFVAAGLIGSGAARRILVVAAEGDTRIESPPFHEAAAAVVLDARADPGGLSGFAFARRADAANLYRSRERLGDTAGCWWERPDDEALRHCWVELASEAAQRSLAAAGVREGEVALVVVNRPDVELVCALQAEVGGESAMAAPGTPGDTVSAALPVALAHADVPARLPPGAASLLVAVGSGPTAAAVVYRHAG